MYGIIVIYAASMAALQMSVEKVKRFENVSKVCQRQLKPMSCKNMQKIVIFLSFEK